MLGNKFLTMFW